MSAETLTPRGVIFIGAHPDDETIMAGGMLAAVSARGIPAHVVCVTDGRGGESGEVAEADTPDARARVRMDELRCAIASLGVTSLVTLGYEDPVMGPGDELFGFAANEATLAAQIADAITRAGADVVLTHGSNGEYGHPAHVQVHRAVRRAVREHDLAAAVYGIAAQIPGEEDRLWNQNDPAHVAIDITPWLEQKLAAMLCHRTQHVLFKRRRKLATVREALRTRESVHRFVPAADGDSAPDDAFLRLLVALGGRRLSPSISD